MQPIPSIPITESLGINETAPEKHLQAFESGG